MAEPTTTTTSATAQKGRLDWVDAARGIAILLVVLYHSTTWLASVGLPLAGWTRVDEALVSLRMPLFFTVAGLFAGKWAQASWEHLWRGKVALFAWVLVVWSVIGAGAFLLGVSAQGHCCSVRGLTLMGTELLLAPLAPRLELWFVWALAVFFLLARLLRRVDSRVLLAATGLLCLLTAGQLDLVNIGWTKAPQYWFFFVLGSRGRRGVLAVGRAHPALLVLAAAVWAGATAVTEATGTSTALGVPALLAVAGVVAGIGASRLLARVRLLRWLGSRTLPVYLAHTPVIISVCALLAFTGAAAHLAPVAGWLVPLVAALAVVAALGVPRLPHLGVLYEPPLRVVDAAVSAWRRRVLRGRPQAPAPPAPAGEQQVRPSPSDVASPR